MGKKTVIVQPTPPGPAPPPSLREQYWRRVAEDKVIEAQGYSGPQSIEQQCVAMRKRVYESPRWKQNLHEHQNNPRPPPKDVNWKHVTSKRTGAPFEPRGTILDEFQKGRDFYPSADRATWDATTAVTQRTARNNEQNTLSVTKSRMDGPLRNIVNGDPPAQARGPPLSPRHQTILRTMNPTLKGLTLPAI
jgi:hypothetical protein|uniref:Uncharacterized protein n=1 Tax=Eutreptiella gymnastica TaxID=73025 RepID=A0A7S4CVA1_9EUGL|mmetsp:Transcript_7170/g.13631  ORF Transcript_7170/g.13631 Transcript_7170/m.13631 type:complete len:191 (-) Transcript_7170:445-1017(-)